MSFDNLITERLRFFENVDLDESELELLYNRKTTLDTCKYYTSDLIASQDSLFRKGENFTILHHNVRSLLKNGEQFKDFLYNLNIKMSCILVTETWLKDTSLPPSLNDFEFIQAG